MYEKILVPLDGSARAEAALPYAEHLAGRLGAEITLLSVMESNGDSSSDTQPSYLEKMVEAVKQGAERFAGKSGRRSIEVESVVLSGEPVERITEYAGKENISLIMMSTHGKSGIKQRALGSVADKLVRATNCPVALIRSFGARPDVSDKGILNKVLVPLDGSKQDEAVLSQIEEFTAKLEVEVVPFLVLAPECYVGGT